jgi:hypothetical protein
MASHILAITNLSGVLVILVALAAPAVQAQSAGRPNQDLASGRLISVGPNVQVSKPFPMLGHYENVAAGDPSHPGRLLVCSTVAHQDLASQGNHCYVSFDNGKTWTTVLELDLGRRNSDPYVTYGRGDTAFVVSEYMPGPTRAHGRDDIYRSVDGGKRWERAASLPLFDRESIVVDKTNSRYAGRVYFSAVSHGYEGPTGRAASVVLFRSTDGGSSFVGPVVRPTVEGSGLLGSSNSVVLSDGTLVFTTFMYKKGRSPNALDEGDLQRTGNAQLQLLTSVDGGESFKPWITVSDVYLDLQLSQGGLYAQLAVDPGSRFFKDRLYAVWPDVGSGRINIRFAYSVDQGNTWSAPITLNDDRAPLERFRGPDHMLPVIGVNEAGVVLVVWYDRRESGDNMGWRIRTTASLDGGVTFTPSVVVSEAANVFRDQTGWIQGEPGISGGGTLPRGAPMGRPIEVDLSINPFYLSGGHTSGMAVGADGVFHPIWSDNRTGISQLWTAPITVRGSVEKHGSRDLAELDDITDYLTLETQSTGYDRSTNTLTLTTRLKNTSRDTLRAPLKVRVIGLTSQLGVPVVVGAANGVSTAGAIWDFSNAIPARGLLPDSASAPRRLTFRLSDVPPIRLARQSGGFTSGLVRFESRIYGKLRRASPIR